MTIDIGRYSMCDDLEFRGQILNEGAMDQSHIRANQFSSGR